MSANNQTQCVCQCGSTEEKVRDWLTLLVEIFNALPYWLSLAGVVGLYFYNRVIHRNLAGKTETVISDVHVLKGMLKQ